jgi:hypothetical protein
MDGALGVAAPRGLALLLRRAAPVAARQVVVGAWRLRVAGAVLLRRLVGALRLPVAVAALRLAVVVLRLAMAVAVAGAVAGVVRPVRPRVELPGLRRVVLAGLRRVVLAVAVAVVVVVVAAARVLQRRRCPYLQMPRCCSHGPLILLQLLRSWMRWTRMSCSSCSSPPPGGWLNLATSRLRALRWRRQLLSCSRMRPGCCVRLLSCRRPRCVSVGCCVPPFCTT